MYGLIRLPQKRRTHHHTSVLRSRKPQKFKIRVEELLIINISMAAMASAKISMLCWSGGSRDLRKRGSFSISAQQVEVQQPEEETEPVREEANEEVKSEMKKPRTPLRPVEPQVNVKSKNLTREYGGQWLSSVTRHVRIYAAYIDPETFAFDQTQMDKLTLILDPTDEFVWTDDTCNMVYSYFQELVDHYEGADLTEYTLRLIGSDIEHYIRKLLYDGIIKYNMDARVLNFSMGKPRIEFNSGEEPLQNAQS